ncbi:MAG: D-amino acid dehydrogenase [Hyphomicrobiales bacterium]
MKAIVLGAGLAGITTAYELNRDGWEVTVVDRESGPAMFTSFANAGLFAPGHSYAWGSPAAPKILLHSLWRHDQALRFKPTSDPALWRWMFKFFGQCTAERAALNTNRKARLALYSQEVFHETLGRHDLHFDGNTGGLIYFYRTRNAFERAGTRKHILTDAGIHIETLSADEAAQKDPALEPVKHQISGALFSEHDESGDAHLFTHELAKVCKKNGVKFLWNRTIKGFAVTRQAISSLITDKGPLTGDIFVNALGVYTPHLARQLEDEVPVYPVKGYSATVPTKGRNNIPKLGGVDEENLIAYCPMGNRLRITATAEFSGYDRSHTPKDFAHMLNITRALFPDSADFDQPSYWAGLRPMTPEGTPIFGKGKCTNLWYVSGLGHMGWTMCHGAGRITADLIAGKTPAIPLEGMVLGE